MIEIPRSFSIAIQSEVTPRRPALPCTAPGGVDRRRVQRERLGQGGLARVGVADHREGPPPRPPHPARPRPTRTASQHLSPTPRQHSLSKLSASHSARRPIPNRRRSRSILPNGRVVPRQRTMTARRRRPTGQARPWQPISLPTRRTRQPTRPRHHSPPPATIPRSQPPPTVPATNPGPSHHPGPRIPRPIPRTPLPGPPLTEPLNSAPRLPSPSRPIHSTAQPRSPPPRPSTSTWGQSCTGATPSNRDKSVNEACKFGPKSLGGTATAMRLTHQSRLP